MLSNDHDSSRQLRRTESFFGLHFDFHATPMDTTIGAQPNESRRRLEQWLKDVRPDYVQCDSKGHPGYASYPTQVGTPAPDIRDDPLRLWRECTAAHNIALYAHYSGVWDAEAVRQHPDWGTHDAHGQLKPQTTSTFGSYVDALLIPHLREIAEVYGLDGAWVDGDCWAMLPDYAEGALLALQEQIPAVHQLPTMPEDPAYGPFLEICRESFRRYVRHYIDVLHQHAPAFQIASNWAFSSFMPEPVTIPVDWLSGDLTMQDSVNAARFEGRVLAQQARQAGLTWDLMAWSFSGVLERGDYSAKSAVQLTQEAASVIALGGGFQAYCMQLRDSMPPADQIETIAAVAAFCRARQPYAQGTQSRAAIGLLLPRGPVERARGGIFPFDNGVLSPTHGTLRCLLDGQHAVDIVLDHTLTAGMGQYHLIVVSEWSDLDPQQERLLRDYVEGGGALLLIGAEAARPFADMLGVKIATPSVAPDNWQTWVRYADQRGALPGVVPEVYLSEQRSGGKALGTLTRGWRFSDAPDVPTTVAASLINWGAGRVGAIYAPLGSRYHAATLPVLRELLGAMVHELLPAPLVTVTGSHLVDVSLQMRKDEPGTLLVHLVNSGGPHANKGVHVFDAITPVGPLTVIVRLAQAPERVLLIPEGQELPVHFVDGQAHISVATLQVHATLVITGAPLQALSPFCAR